ncbi:MAG TPA: hypothetical protein VF761_06175 [Gemmatimonadaceae bacterium]
MYTRSCFIAFLTIAVVASGATSCSGNDSTGPDRVGPPAKVLKISGDSQQGVVAARLWDSLVVEVEDANDHPLKGAQVTFAVVSGGGSVSPTQARTDENGLARTSWLLGTSTAVADSQRLVARLDRAGTTPATFVAIARVGHPITLQPVQGDFQTGTLGAPLARDLVVRLVDPYNNPAADYGVFWGVTKGGSITPTFVKADAAGLARARWTLAASTDSVGTATAFFYDPIPQLLYFHAVVGPP